MGRRALRKVDPSLDLSFHLRQFDDLPAPWNTAALFGRDAPLEVEVGSGKGLFLQRAAEGVAEHNFLGIEVAPRYAEFAAARLAKRAIPNAILVPGDALRIFRELMPDAGLAAVHVYFPDPWWKARHKKRRVLNASFLADVVRTLVRGGRFHFWTDVEEYFQTTLELVARETNLAGPREVEEPASLHDLDFRTHFERRTRLAAKTVYRAEYEKV